MDLAVFRRTSLAFGLLDADISRSFIRKDFGIVFIISVYWRILTMRILTIHVRIDCIRNGFSVTNVIVREQVDFKK